MIGLSLKTDFSCWLWGNHCKTMATMVFEIRFADVCSEKETKTQSRGVPETSTPSDCPQCPAYSLQSLAEHFRVHSHADTEVIGQTEKMSRHG